MLHVLLESGGRRHSRPAGWTLTSVAIHAAIIAAAVALTMRQALPTVERIPLDVIDYVAPEPAPPSTATTVAEATQAQIEFPHEPPLRFPVDVPIGITPMPDAGRIGPIDFGPAVPPTGLGRPVEVPEGGIHTMATVDRIVTPRADNASPEYPASLRSASVEGEVLVQFVVDTTGRVVPASITILRATHGLFGDAVRRWLPRTRYTPAEAGGRVVSQLVQQPIGFSLRR